MTADKLIIGGGLYGLYAALHCAKKGERVLVLEREAAPFRRATTINQARVHMGYHYPRSLSTALKSKNYFERFCRDYPFCILKEFRQIYATSATFSWTNREQFCKFCANADIRCDLLNPDAFFQPGLCDGAYETTEYTYDAALLCDYFMCELSKYPRAELRCSAEVTAIAQKGGVYELTLSNGERLQAPFVLNATYAGVNQIHKLLKLPPFKIKYELCEMILCSVNDCLRDIGLTVMDGPFFSIMPYGKTGLHSLTAVAHTPHITSYDTLPTFPCQSRCDGFCKPESMGNCTDCPAQPPSAWPYMSALARKYLRPELEFTYQGSLFSMKPILMASELDDSRPTVIREYTAKPWFYSVLSGKINTVYDLDVILDGSE